VFTDKTSVMATLVGNGLLDYQPKDFIREAKIGRSGLARLCLYSGNICTVSRTSTLYIKIAYVVITIFYRIPDWPPQGA
jgi:hypothetical protein